MSGTADRLVDEARRLIISGGYNGFSYADLAGCLQIRKASIHHHFPSKVDLVIAVVDQQRAGIRAQIEAFQVGAPAAMDHLLAYADYWRRCILDRSASFCLAGVLAAELPVLPPEVAAAVQGHFSDLREWLEALLTLGEQQGAIRLEQAPALEAEAFLAGVYGAMLISRAFDDPAKFGAIVDTFVRRLRIAPN